MWWSGSDCEYIADDGAVRPKAEELAHRIAAFPQDTSGTL